MRKFNKILMMTVAILLTFVLISGCILSGTMARFAISKNATATATMKKFGLEVYSSGTDLSSSYTLKVGDDEIAAVQSTQNVIAPGTHGCLAWVRIKGTSSVTYDVDFTGAFSLGAGYRTMIFDASGAAVQYFPIGIYYAVYNVTSENNGVLTLEAANITNKHGESINGSRVCHNRKEGNTNNYLFKTYAFQNVASMTSIINGSYEGNTNYVAVYSDNVFDHNNNAAGVAIDRIYAIQWYWPYNTESDYPYKSTKAGVYQIKEYDSQIAEAIANGSTAFNITADLDVDIKQSSPAAT